MPGSKEILSFSADIFAGLEGWINHGELIHTLHGLEKGYALLLTNLPNTVSKGTRRHVFAFSWISEYFVPGRLRGKGKHQGVAFFDSMLMENVFNKQLSPSLLSLCSLSDQRSHSASQGSYNGLSTEECLVTLQAHHPYRSTNTSRLSPYFHVLHCMFWQCILHIAPLILSWAFASMAIFRPRRNFPLPHAAASHSWLWASAPPLCSAHSCIVAIHSPRVIPTTQQVPGLGLPARVKENTVGRGGETGKCW